MRNSQMVLFALLFFTFIGCSKDDNVDETENMESVEFLAYYKPGTEMVLGNTKSIAKVSFVNGEFSYSTFLNVAPENSMARNCAVNNDIMVLGLKQIGLEPNGAYMDLSDNNISYLPLVEPSGNNDFAYFQTETGDVSDNGYIIYSAATNDISYGGEYQPYLLRFDPEDNTTDIAISPTSFVLAQPELGSDTELGLLSRSIFASPDGRYAYGSVDALGTDAGSIHWDYSILYKYDFDTETYTRLGGVDDNDVSIQGMTSDRRFIVYSNHGETQVLDLATEEISISNINTINVKRNAWGKYGPCVGTSNSDLYYKDFDSNVEYIVCSVPGTGWIYNTMFSENGDKIYFMIEGNESNYLCVTDGIAEGSSYDTLSPIPFEFEDMVLIK